MVSPGVLGAIAGFAAALVTLGIPLTGFLYRIDKRARRSVRLLTGDEEVEHGGVLDRLREVEELAARNRNEIQGVKSDRR